ncbi:MAG TPA: efflux RND transporter periplasmic adaptor subunit [Chitinophagaceae bacterium]
MKKYKWLLIIASICLVGAVSWYWKFGEKEKPLLLGTEQPHIGFIANSITATGTVQPVDTVSVGTQVSGTLKYIYADFNSKVKKGQLIAELDKSLFQAQADQVKANLSSARDQLVYQQSNFNRQSQLYNAGAISKADYETALYQYNSAKANVASISAQLQSAEKNLSYADIYSPIDGTVLSRNVSTGQTVAASFNTPTLFVIAKDLTKMQVQADVDEADIGNVKKGQEVTFTVDAFPDDSFTGTVQDVRLNPAVSANVVTYTTIVDAPNENMKLKPGMTASITIYTKQVQHAMLISAKALKYKPDSSLLKQYKIVGLSRPVAQHNQDLNTARSEVKAHHHADSTGIDLLQTEDVKNAIVWIKKDNMITKKFIKIGLNDDTHVQVVEGLNANDVVIDGEQQSSKGIASDNTVKSPFMPQRPGSNSQRPDQSR